jgi:hypothetical protein
MFCFRFRSRTYLCPVKELLFIFFFLPIGLAAQGGPDGVNALRLVERHKQANAARMTMPGYRVQVYFGSERTRAMEFRTELFRLFPDKGAYLLYHQPNFKVRVGDFRTRLEAAGFLQKVNEHFKGAFIVPDDVKFSDM